MAIVLRPEVDKERDQPGVVEERDGRAQGRERTLSPFVSSEENEPLVRLAVVATRLRALSAGLCGG